MTWECAFCKILDKGVQPMSTIVMSTKTNPAILRQAMVRHPVIAYFASVFAFTWLVDLPMVLGKDSLGVFSYSVPLPVYVILFILGAYGPTIAAFLITGAVEGRQGARALFRRYGQWRFGVQWYLFILFAFPLVYLLGAVIWLGVGPVQTVLTHWQAYLTQYLPAVLIFPALITWGEEPGWRGFALTRLQQSSGPLLAALVVGLMHGLWHLPIFLLVNGPVAAGPFNLTGFIINCLGIMAVSLIWAWAFNNARQSILMAVLLHASFNAAQGYIAGLINPYPKEAAYTVLAIYGVIALVLTAVTKARLGYSANHIG
jgi:uncharacterized protein